MKDNPIIPPVQHHQFVIIDPYQMQDDLAFGYWDESCGRYLLGDGDSYSLGELEKSWPNAEFLTWSELENRLKKSL